MAGKITDMTAATSVASTDIVEVTVDPGGTPLTRKATLAQIATFTDAQGLAAHLADATDAHDASAISVVPAGNIAATDVQAALAELDSEKSATGHNHSGTYEPAGTVATHEADTTSVHGIADTSALLDTGDIGVSVQGYDADLTDIAAISDAQGDIIVRGASGWERLAAGTSGYFLKTQGAGANPTWAAASGSVDEAQVALIAQAFGG